MYFHIQLWILYILYQTYLGSATFLSASHPKRTAKSFMLLVVTKFLLNVMNVGLIPLTYSSPIRSHVTDWNVLVTSCTNVCWLHPTLAVQEFYRYQLCA